eukprot:1304794-Alexandrium_andersonii.AAC.1
MESRDPTRFWRAWSIALHRSFARCMPADHEVHRSRVARGTPQFGTVDVCKLWQKPMQREDNGTVTLHTKAAARLVKQANRLRCVAS